MASYVETAARTFTAGAALAQYIRVKLSSSKLAASGVGDDDIGTLESEAFADLDIRDVRLITAQGTRKMVAAAAISVGSRVFQAASGKINDVALGKFIGYALEAATANNDVIEVLPAGWTGAPASGMDIVAAGGTLAMTAEAHHNRIIALDTAAGSVATLPASTGSGAVYKFLVTVTATTNSHVIKVANASDEMRGYVIQDSDTATAPNTWWAADNDDTITLNRSTTGLAAQGEYFEIVDAVLNHFFVRGYSQASGTEATPFSATV